MGGKYSETRLKIVSQYNHRLRKRKGIKIVKAKNTKHLIDAMVGKIRKEDDHLSNLSILNAHLAASDKELLELERLAEIGRAFEKALKEEYGFINFTRYAGAVPEKWEMKESEYNDVLDWAKASNKNNAI